MFYAWAHGENCVILVNTDVGHKLENFKAGKICTDMPVITRKKNKAKSVVICGALCLDTW